MVIISILALGLSLISPVKIPTLVSGNILVNSVAPGFIASNMTNKLNENQKNSILERIPMKRLGTPEDIAKAVGFLCSENASYITGQTIHVNGGLALI